MLKLDDIAPDGVRIIVRWDKMVVGASVFIPCINARKAREQVNVIFKRKGWQYKAKTTIENNKLGVRIWRTV
jgi:hypothetical protein|tara:strand:+ start:231 stop:446 length:216 start_codon:yes stop_codon:yes gene_type:complete